MHTFTVKVKTQTGQQISYGALAPRAVDLAMAAVERFGICAITVKPA